MRAGDPNRVPSWMLTGEGDRGFVVTLHRDDDVPVEHLPPSKPPRVLREEARLRAEAEALLARMSSEATRAKTLAAATATAAASTRTIPAPKHSSARGDLPAPRRRGDAPRPDPSRQPQRPDARRRSLREPRAAHPEPPPRAPRDPSLERVAREAVERARRRLADAQTARVETDEARRRRDDAVAAAAAARTRRVAPESNLGVDALTET